MKVLVFGSCNIDYVYYLDHIVLNGETETTYNFEVFSGGKGLNQAIASAKAGADAYFAGCVGYDGEMLTDIMTESGVNISYINKIDEKNGHAIIQVSKSGENSIFLYPGSNEKISEEYADSVLENFEAGDIILLQNEINNIDYIIKKAQSKNMCIILNPSPFDGRLKTIDFNCLTYIILNEVEAKAISGCNDIDESLRYIKSKYPSLKIILTLGVCGSIYTDSICELYQPAFRVDTVDTTAAGDTFTGYFAAALARGEEYKQALEISSAAAALAASGKGAAPSIPEKREAEEAARSLKPILVNNSEKRLHKIINEYADKNLQSASLEDLANILGYSAAYTGRLVKKLTSRSFSAFIQDKRCDKAAQLLLDTDLPISEIIDDVGYKNESFFRLIFKERFGKNPLEYRKKDY